MATTATQTKKTAPKSTAVPKSKSTAAPKPLKPAKLAAASASTPKPKSPAKKSAAKPSTAKSAAPKSAGTAKKPAPKPAVKQTSSNARKAPAQKSAPPISEKRAREGTPISIGEWREVVGIALMGLGAVLAYFVIFGSTSGAGKGINGTLYGLAGSLCYLIPILLLWVGFLVVFSHERRPPSLKHTLLVSILVLCLGAGMHVFVFDDITKSLRQYTFTSFAQKSFEYQGGGAGVLGALLSWPLYYWIGLRKAGTIIALLAITVADLVLMQKISLLKLSQQVQERARGFQEQAQTRTNVRAERKIEIEFEEDRVYEPYDGMSEKERRRIEDEAILDELERWPETEEEREEREEQERIEQEEREQFEAERAEMKRRRTNREMEVPKFVPAQSRNRPDAVAVAEDPDEEETGEIPLYLQRKVPRKKLSANERDGHKLNIKEPKPLFDDAYDDDEDENEDGYDDYDQNESIEPIIPISMPTPAAARTQQTPQPKPKNAGERLKFDEVYNRGNDRVMKTATTTIIQTLPGGEQRNEKIVSGGARFPSNPDEWEEIGIGSMIGAPDGQEEDDAPFEADDDDFAFGPEDQEFEGEGEGDMSLPINTAPVTDIRSLPRAVPAGRTAAAMPIATPVKKKPVESAALPMPEEEPYNYPPIDLLTPSTPSKVRNQQQLDEEKAKTLIATLQSFGISARLIGIAHGPTVTRFELSPAAGVKVSRITALADDIALNLAAINVRIEAPIPGKAAVGVEVPNEVVEIVPLRDVLESNEARRHPSRLATAFGRDNAGKYIVGDLAKMPHVLIAGATGAGKSVCINCIICSILYRATPDEVRLIMIDPKVVELSVYNGVPHLLVPVVTDPKKAASALDWAVSEMNNRYQRFSKIGVRDMKGFNQNRPESEPAMPQIVIIIDELADLMMVTPGEVEDSICRLAQLARAAGIHLVIATQRPSVNVITGVIKANIPSRIAFTVASQVDSRTILDVGGAEKLLGRGDMLFAPAGTSKPLRVQGAWVSDDEVHSVVEYIKNLHPATYDSDIIEQMNAANMSDAEKEDTVNEYDDLLPQAVEICVEAGQASISMLQRRLRVGYARAGRLIDEMASRGVVSQAEGAKPRNVLITREQYKLMFEE